MALGEECHVNAVAGGSAGRKVALVSTARSLVATEQHSNDLNDLPLPKPSS